MKVLVVICIVSYVVAGLALIESFVHKRGTDLQVKDPEDG